MQKLLPKHPLIRKKKMIQFQIDESVTHSHIPIFGNHDTLFQIKDQGQFRNLESCESAGRRNPNFELIKSVNYVYLIFLFHFLNLCLIIVIKYDTKV